MRFTLLLLIINGSTLSAKEPPALKLALNAPLVAFSANKLVLGWHGDESNAVEQRVHFKPPNLWRHDIVGPDGEILKTTIQRGPTEWIFYPETSTLIERDVRALRKGTLTGKDLRALLEKNFKFKKLKAKKIAGRTASGIQITPLAGQGPRRTLWVDPETGIVLKRRQTNFRGKQVRESRITNLVLNPDHEDDLFSPEGLGAARRDHSPVEDRVKDAKQLSSYGLAGSLWKPELPFGYQLDAVRRLKIENTQIFHFRYVNGLSVVSVFISPIPVESHSLEVVDYEEEDIDFSASAWAGNVLTFDCGKQHCAAIGDLSTKALKKISRVFP